MSSWDLGPERDLALERARPGGGTRLGLGERERPGSLTMTESSGVIEADRRRCVVSSPSEGTSGIKRMLVDDLLGKNAATNGYVDQFSSRAWAALQLNGG